MLTSFIGHRVSGGKMKRMKIVVTIDGMKSSRRRLLIIIVRKYSKANSVVRWYTKGVIATVDVQVVGAEIRIGRRGWLLKGEMTVFLPGNKRRRRSFQADGGRRK